MNRRMGMNMRTNSRALLFRCCCALVLTASLIACSKKYFYKEIAVPYEVAQSPRLRKLFQDTKLVCFGRYALAVPKEAQVIWGSASFPSKISSFPGTGDLLKDKVNEDIAKIKYDDKGSEITYDNPGPIESSWQIRYFDSKAAKRLKLLFFNTYVNNATKFSS
jgi:hypothetical protein